MRPRAKTSPADQRASGEGRRDPAHGRALLKLLPLQDPEVSPQKSEQDTRSRLPLVLERSRSRSRSERHQARVAALSGWGVADDADAWESSQASSLVLRSSLEEDYGVDSWNLRDAPSRTAKIVGSLRTGQAFQVVGQDDTGQWFKVPIQTEIGERSVAYAARYFSGTEAFVRAGALELREPSGLSTASSAASSPASRAGAPAMERTSALLQDLVALRRHYERLSADERDTERSRISRSIEHVMEQLDFFGVSFDEILDSEDPMTLLLRGKSFPHRDFANPRAETCWLSCMFQSLWHSRVFHAAFELYLAPSKCTPKPDERVLTALQKTWAEYQKAEVEEDGAEEDDFGPRLVPTWDLVEGFGEGYGDMSEALASVENEFSRSSNPAAVKIAELMVLIPITTLGDEPPTPAMAWNQAEEWQITKKPIMAVDLSLPAEATQATNRKLARDWIPASRLATHSSASSSGSDLGPRHRLVALVCYMWNLRHYVTFCRRQRDAARCVFFNDLPGLTYGAPMELDWQQVPELCYRYTLTPRLALYESLGAAEEVVRSFQADAAEAEPEEALASDADQEAGTAEDARESCRHQ